MTTHYLLIAACSLVGLTITLAALLKGWEGWLALKTREIDRLAARGTVETSPAGARIELADLRERIRRLEAIAAGVDL
jgi:hypothetical protein